MPTIDITGTIQDAGGNGVEGASVLVSPEAASPGGEEAQGGVGVATVPVRYLTAADGTFTAAVLSGFRYRLTIDAIGYSRTFVAPAVNTRFDLLGLVPLLETVADFDTCADPATTEVTVSIDATPINTVNTRFTSISIEMAAAQDGAYTEAVALDLEAGRTLYTTDIASADSTNWFRARYRNIAEGDDGEYSAPKSAAGPDADLVFSVEELKALYLFGTDLTDGDGNAFPDRMFQHYIESAIDWLEKELDIPIIARQITNELHDHFAQDYGRWGYFQLRNYPIVIPSNTTLGEPFSTSNPSPVSVTFQYPSQESSVAILDEWVVITEEGTKGVIQIVPGQGNIADVLLIPGALMPMWSGSQGRVPGIWRFTYKAGFCPGELPSDLKDVIGMKAAIGIFNIAGDLVAGAGIANTSISVPGLSQSIGTTSSATNSGYGARIGQYEKQLKAALPALKRYYGKASKLVVV